MDFVGAGGYTVDKKVLSFHFELCEHQSGLCYQQLLEYQWDGRPLLESYRSLIVEYQHGVTGESIC